DAVKMFFDALRQHPVAVVLEHFGGGAYDGQRGTTFVRENGCKLVFERHQFALFGEFGLRRCRLDMLGLKLHQRGAVAPYPLNFDYPPLFISMAMIYPLSQS